MIDIEDLHIIKLSDDLECIANEIEKSLIKQIEVLKDAGLEDTTYYKSLSEFTKNKEKK